MIRRRVDSDAFLSLPEWGIQADVSLRIVPLELWEQVRSRRKEVRRSWPPGIGKLGLSAQQRRRENGRLWFECALALLEERAGCSPQSKTVLPTSGAPGRSSLMVNLPPNQPRKAPDYQFPTKGELRSLACILCLV